MKIWQLLHAIKRLNDQHGILLAKYLDLNTPKREEKELLEQLKDLETQAEFYLRTLNSTK